jgi:hypothetical protein
VPAPGAEWANDRPANPVEYDLGADDAIQERCADTVALGLGGEAIFP